MMLRYQGIGYVVSTVVLSWLVGVRFPRTNRIDGWPVPNASPKKPVEIG